MRKNPFKPSWVGWIGVGLCVSISLMLIRQWLFALSAADQERLLGRLVLLLLFGACYCTAFFWQRALALESPLQRRLQTLALVAAGAEFMLVLLWVKAVW